MFTVSEVWDKILDFGIATKEELQLICSINGYTIETLNDVLFCRTGYHDIEQLLYEDEEEHEEVHEDEEEF